MIENWERLTRWLRIHAPHLLNNFNEPASEAEISAFEAKINSKLPPTVRASYLIHDGETPESRGIFATWRFLPLAEVAAQIETVRFIAKKVKKKDFDNFDATKLIPVMRSGGGDLYCVENSIDGAESELVEWWHESPSRIIKAVNFAVYFADFIEKLENGEIVAIENFNGLVSVSDL